MSPVIGGTSPSQIPTPGVVPNQLEQTANQAAKSSKLRAPKPSATFTPQGPIGTFTADQLPAPAAPAIPQTFQNPALPAIQPPADNIPGFTPTVGGQKNAPTTMPQGPIGTFTQDQLPPTAPGGGPSFPSSVATSAIDPNNSLRGQNILPGQDPRLEAAQGRTDTANDIALSGLQNLVPMDRGAIASDVLGQLRESSQDAFNQDRRAIGADAARFGRLGSGVTTTRLGDLASNREQDFSRAARSLASESAALKFGDQRDLVNTALSTGGQFSGTEGQRFGQGRDTRNEVRGERDFENMLARTAVEDRIRQTILSDDLLNSGVNRTNSRLDMQRMAGFGGDPSGVLLDSAANRNAAAGQGSATAANALYQYALNRGR